MNQLEKNWAGNYTYQSPHIDFPQTTEQAQEIIRKSGKIKPLGSRHSFNDIADSPGSLISLENIPPSITIERPHNTVTISANIKYGRLGQYLHQEGYALPNLASLPHISVAGACSTATHGSGVNNGSLATAVSTVGLITASGELVTFSRHQNPDTFPGAVVSLGGLGLITRLTLDIVPTFAVSQNVYEKLPFSQLENYFDDIMACAYSVSLFTDWQDDYINQVWVKRLAAEEPPVAVEPTMFGAKPAVVERHPIITISAENCTPQLGVPGPWHTRLPHFRMEFTPSAGDELQSEYFVPRPDAYAALLAVGRLKDQIAPLLQICEIRTIAADNHWLSPCYQQDSVALHFTWKPDWANVRRLLPNIEAALQPFNVRPHWAKLFTIPPAQLQLRYPKLLNFQDLLHHHDPTGKFRNQFLDKYIFG